MERDVGVWEVWCSWGGVLCSRCNEGKLRVLCVSSVVEEG